MVKQQSCANCNRVHLWLVDEDHALLAGRLDWDHRDPFDRMLAAQAMIEALVIITGDPAFAGCPGVPTLW